MSRTMEANPKLASLVACTTCGLPLSADCGCWPDPVEQMILDDLRQAGVELDKADAARVRELSSRRKPWRLR